MVRLRHGGGYERNVWQRLRQVERLHGEVVYLDVFSIGSDQRGKVWCCEGGVIRFPTQARMTGGHNDEAHCFPSEMAIFPNHINNI